MKNFKYIFFLSVLFFAGKVNAQKTVLSLQECVEMALEKNISLKQTQLGILEAELSKLDAKGSFLPTLNAQTSHSWNVGLNQNITTGLLENTTTQYTSLGANVNLTLYNGLKNINQLHRANLSILANQYQLDDMADDVKLLVANAFLQVMFNKEILTVQESQFKITTEDARRTKELIEAGVKVKSDILEIEATLATQEQSLVQAKNNLRLTKINLAQMLLITDYENFDIVVEDLDVPISDILLQTPKEIFEKALTFRNDIQLYLTNIEIAKKDISLAKGNLQPSLTAYYGYNSRVSYTNRLAGDGTFRDVPIGFVSGSGDQVLRSVEQNKVIGPLSFQKQLDNNEGHNFGVRLSIPIFNGNSIRNNVKRSRVNLLRSENQFEQEKLNLESSINQAYNSALGAYKFYEAAKKTVLARERTYQDAINRFDAGVMNSYDFNQITERYNNATSDLVRAKFDYIFKLKVLEFYFGIPITG